MTRVLQPRISLIKRHACRIDAPLICVVDNPVRNVVVGIIYVELTLLLCLALG